MDYKNKTHDRHIMSKCLKATNMNTPQEEDPCY